LHLDVMAFDLRPYTGLEEKLHAQGVEVKTLRDLAGDPDRDRKVYALYWEATEDVPKEREITPMEFKEWVKWTMNDPLVPHAGYFIATHGTAYVGVRRPYRGRGIALALQIRGIAYARENGHPLIKTSTSVTNQPMLSLYTRLGFAPQPDWIQLEKVCRGE
jgi:mycothiol synthase